MSKSIKLKDNTYLDINSIHRNILMLKFNNVQYITDTNIKKLTFDTILFEKGNRLSISNGGIKIGANISKVRVDLKLWIQNEAGYGAFYILKNNSEEAYNLIPTKVPNGDIWNSASQYTYLDVKENDIIYAAVRFSIANNGNSCWGSYKNACRLSVEQIE